jgi:magnesium chelatase subunit D
MIPRRISELGERVTGKFKIRVGNSVKITASSLIPSFTIIDQMRMQELLTYPFSAIVALEDLKLALVLNAVNPKIGGLLIRGSKGSGKTTAVRALAQILSKVKVVKDCPFNCSPEDPSNMCDKCRGLYAKNRNLPFEEKKMRVIELPLGATEDRVVGSLDVEKAIRMGVEALDPGILAEANQNILYVDEVNLLPDHIADDLLDAAATGWNVVEREGISVRHPSRFIFIGTMNPEEGQLRPQLLDRLALSVEVQRISEAKDRIEVVKRNMQFEADPESFLSKFSADQELLKEKIVQARRILPDVRISDKFIEIICQACLELKVDGMRPDIVIAKTARTLAAFENKTDVAAEDILKAAELALSHRTREGGFLEPASPQEIREALFTKLEEAKSSADSQNRTAERVKQKKDKREQPGDEEKKRILLPFGFRKKRSNREKEVGKAKKAEGSISQNFIERSSSLRKANFLYDSKPEKGGTSPAFAASPRWPRPRVTRGTAFIDKIRESRLLHFRFLFKTKKKSKRTASNIGKRAEAITATHRGRARGWRIPVGKPTDVHFPATIRTAAKMQRYRSKDPNTTISIHPEDVREKRRIYRAPMTMIFVLDLSESMLHSIDGIREVMLKLHTDAYRYRDKVGIVTFKEMGAVVVQHPTTNLKMVANKLLRLRMSGFTPLAAGMQKALEVLRESRRRDLSTVPVMVVVTDGDTNVPLKRDLQTGEIREFNLLDTAFYKYEDEAIRDVLAVSELIRREDIYTVVVNAVPISPGLQETSGSVTTRMIASLTNGVHYELSGGIMTRKEETMGEISEAIHHAQKSISRFHYLSARAYLNYETRLR